MMRYLYRCPDGHKHDLEFDVGTAPQIWHGPCMLCGKSPMQRVFTPPLIVHGPGMVNYSSWGDKVQKSVEGQERFGKPGVPLK